MDEELRELFQKLDETDDKLLELFVYRLNLLKDIGTLKKRKEMEIFNPERERATISRLLQNAPEEFHASIDAIYAKIFEVSGTIQNKKKR
ncbi:MAG: chorismate mutase [Lachnospiraceae bacterium]|nr:chorismate mutase [Lachnospiraceae bacterium]